MWHGILAVILLPSLTVGDANRNASTFLPQQTPPTPTASPRYKAYTFYESVRRGTREEVAVEATTAGFVTVANSRVAGIVPLKLELQPAEGLAFGEFHYPKTYSRRLNSQAKPVKVAWRSLIRFTVAADANATLGEHVVKGRLTFQPIRYDSAIGPVQQLDIEIPIHVVAHNARVNRSKWPVPHTPPALTVVMVVLSPVIIPLSLLYYTVCGVEGSQRCPD